MASRKDLLKAHKFTTDRLVASLVDRDPDRLDSPLRRIGMGTFASVMIGVLVMAGFGVFGLVTQGGNASSWKDSDSAVIVDSQAGLVFWYTQQRLHPMENITSAKLASGGAEVTTLKTKSLKDVPRDKLLGIRDAPRQLPDPADMGAYPMRVCATAPDEDDTRRTTLTMGDPDLGTGAADTAIAMRGSSNDYYLIVNGIAHLVPKESAQEVPPLLLEYEVLRPTFGLLNTLPQGSPLDAEAIMQRVPGADEKSSQNPVGQATRVGQLVHVSGQSATYVMVEDGLSRLSPLEHAAVQVSRPNAPSIEVTADEASQHLSKIQNLGAPDLPAEMPDVLRGQAEQDASICATWTEPNQPPTLSTGDPTPEVRVPANDPARADVVVVPPLRGALVRNEQAEQGPAVTLITEGNRFSVPDADSLNALGYGEVAQDAVPAQVMGLIPPGLPAGQALSIAAAQTESLPT